MQISLKNKKNTIFMGIIVRQHMFVIQYGIETYFFLYLWKLRKSVWSLDISLWLVRISIWAPNLSLSLPTKHSTVCRTRNDNSEVNTHQITSTFDVVKIERMPKIAPYMALIENSFRLLFLWLPCLPAVGIFVLRILVPLWQSIVTFPHT